MQQLNNNPDRQYIPLVNDINKAQAYCSKSNAAIFYCIYILCAIPADVFYLEGIVAGKIRKTQAAIVSAFAKRLRELRIERGLSQAKLARKTGVNLSYLNKLERAEAAPGLDLVARLADGLGVSVSDLVSPGIETREPLSAMRAFAVENFGAAVQKAGRQELAMLSMLGAMLDSALSRNR